MGARWQSRASSLLIARRSYSTSFPNSETPLSENESFIVVPAGGNGALNNIGNTPVTSAVGLAYATQLGNTAPNKYLDSCAFLRGSFPPNQKGTGTIHLAGGITGLQECEILLRCSVSPTGRGMWYECNLAKDGAYQGIVQINGDGTFTGAPTVTPGGFADGSVFSAQMVGNVITVFLNGTQLQQLDVTVAFPNNPPIPRGVPGIGFYLEDNGGTTIRQNYCFTSWQAVAL